MEEALKSSSKFLVTTTTVHIYSFPYFTLESFLAAVICVMYVLLHFEITNIGIRTLRLKPNSITMSGDYNGIYRINSSSSTVSRLPSLPCETISKSPSTRVTFRKMEKTVSRNSQLGWVLNAGDDKFAHLMMENPPVERLKSVITLTPQQYVKREKERRKQKCELKYCLQSLTTLYENVISKKLPPETIAYHIEQVKENLQTAKLSNETAKYLGREAEAMTKSLFDLLERIVTTSSVNNPLPFKGNITTLAFDAGNLSPKDSPIYGNNVLTCRTESDTSRTEHDVDSSLATDLSG